ncbi:metallophosphoesterase [Parashewanella tropica]|uniref:metallophosphoesterase n=1 Tax=Parashewanella tropica TaxID=2547970 RepID=UPI00105A6313|nr:metallophosphoesterase [Parashewanella tropica]
MQDYDIIGDIHGHASKLVNLLIKMGYVKLDGAYQHPTRKAIFVGDYIDRGPENAATIELVKAMVEQGSALAIMGNHEFNAICYATSHPEKQDEFLRKRNAKHTKQHQTFLDEFPLGSEHHRKALDWFKTLPVFLDLGDIRIAHACWYPPSVEHLRGRLNSDGTLTDDMYVTASNTEHPDNHAIENVMKAVEQDLPDGVFFRDKDGNPRHQIRIKWWGGITPTYKNLALTVPEQYHHVLPDSEIPNAYTYQDDVPVFFGHYWLQGKPTVQSAKAVCVDYSVAKGGELVAYRWSGEKELTDDNFVVSE